MPFVRQTKAQYTQSPVELSQLEFRKESSWLYVGVDLAPNDMLESGIAMVDRQCTLLQMDKLYSDASILQLIQNLGPPGSVIVAIDMPKNLDIESRWQQELVRMHPLKLYDPLEEKTMDRFTQRARDIYDKILEMGAFPVLYLSHQVKMQYELFVPFRSRTPQGCRALQSFLKSKLKIRNIPTNLAPSSVLDAIVGSYAAWTIFQGEDSSDFSLYRDEQHRIIFHGNQRVERPPSSKKGGLRHRRGPL